MPLEPDAPSDVPLFLALLSRVAGRDQEARMWADSLQRTASREVAELESGSLDPFVQIARELANRAIGHALAGRRADALRDARRAEELLPVSRDAVDGPQTQRFVVYAYVLAGDQDSAFRLLDRLASVPGPLSVGDLRTNPLYDALRDDPRYSPLVAKLEAAERSGTGTR
jgi:hypothetical protein